MSPARLSIEEMSESELSFNGDMWSAQPNKKQKMQHAKADIDLVDDLETLWETKWKSALNQKRAPFQDASPLDIAPLITALLQQGVTSTHAPAFTQAFLTAATDLAGPKEATSARLLNACALLRVARYPLSSSSSVSASSSCPLKQSAYALQKQLHARAARMWDTESPVEEVLIPHTAAALTDDAPVYRGGAMPPQQRRPQIPALVRVPLETLLTGRACPAVVVVSRSDRMGCTGVCEDVLARGWAVVVVESRDEEGEESLCKSVLAWMGAMGFYDMGSVVVLAEGDAALRVASAVGERLRGVVALLEREVVAVEEDVMFEAQPLCPSLVVSERRTGVPSNGMWTPVGDAEGETQDDSHSDLYAFGAESKACIGRLHTVGQSQLYAWMGDLMAGREGGHFWTVIPAPGKLADAMFGRFGRDLTPPSPEDLVVRRTSLDLS